MNMKNKNIAIIFGLFFLLSSCAKEWLDEKSDKSLVIPRSLNDFQAIIDNSTVMNISRVPNLGEISSDDYEVPIERWSTLSVWEKNTHKWEERIFENRDGEESWNNSYQQIYYANLVLEGLKEINVNKNNENHFNSIQGAALFHRAFALFHLSQIFCDPYQKSTASNKLGLPLRNSIDLEVNLERANLESTFNFIINDLLQAKDLLPERVELSTRPSKSAALALLAKIFLITGDYESSFIYADSCLKLSPELMDYNELDLSSNYPYERFNKEVIFYAMMHFAPIITATRINVSPKLLSLYENNDLRREGFYRTVGNNITFKGSYNQSSSLFGGISTNEIYLIKSETLARLGQTDKSIEVLNHLLENRFKDFVPIKISDNNQLIKRILIERRKELSFRGIRWSDLKRLNLEAEHETTLVRETPDGEHFTLTPNSKKWTLPIPDVVIQLSSGIIQNDRK